MMQLTETVKQLLIINIIFYIGSAVVGDVAYSYLSLYYVENPNFEIWQFVTHMFMHAQFPEIKHILFNMLGLVMFGSAIEHFWGAKKFLFFYISCGLGAALLHTLINYYHFSSGLNILIENGFTKEQVLSLLNSNQYHKFEPFMPISDLDNFLSSYYISAVGASGALYGILVAFALLFPNASLMLLFLPIPIKAKYFVPFLVASDLYMGISGTSILGGGGIAHFAHVGGALTGLIMAWYWKKNDFNKHRWN
uniref:rhomboid family intramembrane serine protease n=1 Tax=Flavobacterium sp. TaxID=239 RepID=UPI0040491852